MRNPCRDCVFAHVDSKGSRGPNTRPNLACDQCEKRKKYEEYLNSKRKFMVGEPITTMQELLEQEWVFWNHTIKHIEVIKSNQLRTVLGWLRGGLIRKAIKKEEEK